MRVSIIVAAARNGVIGNAGEIPWHLPDDQRFFRAKTTGHTIIIGRKTFDSIGKALPRRKNYVLTRRPHPPVDDIQFFRDLEAAIACARAEGESECFIAGGEAIYREALANTDKNTDKNTDESTDENTEVSADTVYLTHVDAEPEGDTYFPPLDPKLWRCIEREPHPIDDRHAHAFTIETWRRRGTTVTEA